MYAILGLVLLVDADVNIMPYMLLRNRVTESYELPDLPYSMAELEPYVDESTVKVHYHGHHKSYQIKINIALQAWREVCVTYFFYDYFLLGR